MEEISTPKIIKQLFISQPMNGREDEEILAEREKIIKTVENLYPDNVIYVIDSFIKDDSMIPEIVPKDNYPIYYLGSSIEDLAKADIAYFAKGFKETRGCKFEYNIATEYHIPNIIIETTNSAGNTILIKNSIEKIYDSGSYLAHTDIIQK